MDKWHSIFEKGKKYNKIVIRPFSFPKPEIRNQKRKEGKSQVSFFSNLEKKKKEEANANFSFQMQNKDLINRNQIRLINLRLQKNSNLKPGSSRAMYQVVNTGSKLQIKEVK
jgi:hypothetical protein